MVPAAPSLATLAPAAAPDGTPPMVRAVIEANLVTLSRLTQIGMEIAETCGREAKALATAEAAAPLPAPEAGAAPLAPAQPRDIGLAFSRIARSVRMTIALQSRLLKDLADLDKAAHLDRLTQRDRRRRRLHGLIEQAVWTLAPKGDDRDEGVVEDEVEQLTLETYERLTDAEDDVLLDGRSFDDVVAGICADLGLSPEWTARVTAATAPPVGGGRDRGDSRAAQPPAPWPPDFEAVWSASQYQPASRDRPRPSAGSG